LILFRVEKQYHQAGSVKLTYSQVGNPEVTIDLTGVQGQESLVMSLSEARKFLAEIYQVINKYDEFKAEQKVEEVEP
jgi:hypothetical protein